MTVARICFSLKMVRIGSGLLCVEHKMETVSPSTATIVPFTIGFRGASGGGRTGGANGQKPRVPLLPANSHPQCDPIYPNLSTLAQDGSGNPCLAILFTRTGALRSERLCSNPSSTPYQLGVDPCPNPSGPHFSYLENELNNSPNRTGATENLWDRRCFSLNKVRRRFPTT